MELCEHTVRAGTGRRETVATRPGPGMEGGVENDNARLWPALRHHPLQLVEGRRLRPGGERGAAIGQGSRQADCGFERHAQLAAHIDDELFPETVPASLDSENPAGRTPALVAPTNPSTAATSNV